MKGRALRAVDHGRTGRIVVSGGRSPLPRAFSRRRPSCSVGVGRIGIRALASSTHGGSAPTRRRPRPRRAAHCVQVHVFDEGDAGGGGGLARSRQRGDSCQLIRFSSRGFVSVVAAGRPCGASITPLPRPVLTAGRALCGRRRHGRRIGRCGRRLS